MFLCLSFNLSVMGSIHSVTKNSYDLDYILHFMYECINSHGVIAGYPKLNVTYWQNQGKAITSLKCCTSCLNIYILFWAILENSALSYRACYLNTIITTLYTVFVIVEWKPATTFPRIPFFIQYFFEFANEENSGELW